MVNVGNCCKRKAMSASEVTDDKPLQSVKHNEQLKKSVTTDRSNLLPKQHQSGLKGGDDSRGSPTRYTNLYK